MRNIIASVSLGLLIAACGCGKDSPKNVVNTEDGKKLSVAVPKKVVVMQGQEKKFSVTLVRAGFTDEIKLSFESMPAGVSIDESTRTVNGNDETFFTLRAGKDAKLTGNAPVKLTARAGELHAEASLAVTVQESLENLQSRKQAFEKQARGRFKKLEAQLQGMQNNAGNLKDDNKKAQALKQIAEVVEDLGRARKHLEALTAAPVEEWENLKPKLEASLDHVSKRVKILEANQTS